MESVRNVYSFLIKQGFIENIRPKGAQPRHVLSRGKKFRQLLTKQVLASLGEPKLYSLPKPMRAEPKKVIFEKISQINQKYFDRHSADGLRYIRLNFSAPHYLHYIMHSAFDVPEKRDSSAYSKSSVEFVFKELASITL